MKRDDVTGGAEAGNKIRKLEFLLADALERGADTSSRAAASSRTTRARRRILARRLGLARVLFLRHDRAVARSGARSRSPATSCSIDSSARDPHDHARELPRSLAGDGDAARELEAKGARAYVIPEGGSNGLGALGYVEAMREVREQLDAGGAEGEPFDVVVHACGSGGTAAGVALGAPRTASRARARDRRLRRRAHLRARRSPRIVGEARALDAALGAPAPLVVDDRTKGPAYAVSTPSSARVIDVARASGLILDPVYTGKAFFGLMRLAAATSSRGARVLFLHTGGLPGLLADGDAFRAEL